MPDPTDWYRWNVWGTANVEYLMDGEVRPRSTMWSDLYEGLPPTPFLHIGVEGKTFGCFLLNAVQLASSVWSAASAAQSDNPDATRHIVNAYRSFITILESYGNKNALGSYLIPAYHAHPHYNQVRFVFDVYSNDEELDRLLDPDVCPTFSHAPGNTVSIDITIRNDDAPSRVPGTQKVFHQHTRVEYTIDLGKLRTFITEPYFYHHFQLPVTCAIREDTADTWWNNLGVTLMGVLSILKYYPDPPPLVSTMILYVKKPSGDGELQEVYREEIASFTPSFHYSHPQRGDEYQAATINLSANQDGLFYINGSEYDQIRIVHTAESARIYDRSRAQMSVNVEFPDSQPAGYSVSSNPVSSRTATDLRGRSYLTEGVGGTVIVVEPADIPLGTNKIVFSAKQSADTGGTPPWQSIQEVSLNRLITLHPIG